MLDAIGEDGTPAVPTHSGDNPDPSGWGDPPVPESRWPAIRANTPPYGPHTAGRRRRPGDRPHLARRPAQRPSADLLRHPRPGTRAVAEGTRPSAVSANTFRSPACRRPGHGSCAGHGVRQPHRLAPGRIPDRRAVRPEPLRRPRPLGVSLDDRDRHLGQRRGTRGAGGRLRADVPGTARHRGRGRRAALPSLPAAVGHTGRVLPVTRQRGSARDRRGARPDTSPTGPAPAEHRIPTTPLRMADTPPRRSRKPQSTPLHPPALFLRHRKSPARPHRCARAQLRHSHPECEHPFPRCNTG
nr:AAC(3) family N-acetyltransferase [Streptomyces sp. SID8014]